MPRYAFDISFNNREGDITIRFEDKLLAEAYHKKTGDKCTLPKSTHGFYEVNLPRLVHLDYVRCSDHTNDLVFVFLDETAAKAWREDLALVSREGKEVRIKRRYRRGELDNVLGVSRKSDTAGEGSKHSAGYDHVQQAGSSTDNFHS